jgi:hypothetical protein
MFHAEQRVVQRSPDSRRIGSSHESGTNAHIHLNLTMGSSKSRLSAAGNLTYLVGPIHSKPRPAVELTFLPLSLSFDCSTSINALPQAAAYRRHWRRPLWSVSSLPESRAPGARGTRCPGGGRVCGRRPPPTIVIRVSRNAKPSSHERRRSMHNVGCATNVYSLGHSARPASRASSGSTYGRGSIANVSTTAGRPTSLASPSESRARGRSLGKLS